MIRSAFTQPTMMIYGRLSSYRKNICRQMVPLQQIKLISTEATAGQPTVEHLLNQINTKLDKVDHRIDNAAISTQNEFKKINSRLDSVDHRLDSVDHRLDSVDHRLDKVCVDVKGLTTQVGKIGVMWENQTRLFVSRQFGESFSKGMKVKSTIDAVHLVFRNIADADIEDRLEKIFQVSPVVSNYIEEKKVMLRYFDVIINEWIEDDKTNQARDLFKRFHEDIYHVPSAERMEKSGASDNANNDAKIMRSVEERFGLRANGVGRLIGAVDQLALPGRESLMSKLVMIKKDLEYLDKNPARLSECESSGITLLTFDALSRYVDSVNMENPGKNITLSDALKSTVHQYFRDIPSELEIDVRGSISMAVNHCTISLGEIKSNPDDVAKAKSQLFTRLMFMKLIVSLLFGRVDTWVLRGFVFSDFSEKQREENGKSANGISFYLFGGSK